MTTWKTKMTDIIAASQESRKSHERLFKDLREIYDSIERKLFAQEFLRLLVYPMGVEPKSPYVDNCISFLAKFAVNTAPNNDEMEENGYEENEVGLESPIGFFLAVLRFITNILQSTNKSARVRSCQFLNIILVECGAHNRSNAINDKIWDRLLKALVERCKDKCVRVRHEAVSALSRLQQPTDSNCPAIAALMFLMRYDPNADIRCQCVHLVSTTKATISVFVERCRDSNRVVRSTVYNEIAERKLFKYLTIQQRLIILRRGLADADESVRTVCEGRVIASWLDAVDNNIPELVNRLDMVTSRKTCELLLDVLFKQRSPTEFADVFSTMTDGWQSYDWVKPERVFTLRHFVQFIMTDQRAKNEKRKFRSADVEEWMDKVLPSLFDLTNFIETYITKDTESEELDLVDGALLRNFTVCQFVELLTWVDKSDVAGRNRLQRMFDTVVLQIDPSVLPSLVRLHYDLHRSGERTIEWMAEAISDWTAVPTPALPLAVGFPDQTVSFALDALNLDDDEPADDKMSQNLFKSLAILSEVLKLAEIRTLTTTLRSLYENLVLPSVQNPEPGTRNLAVLCLGLSCLLDRTLASKHVDLFLQILTVDVDLVRRTAVKVLFDLLLVYKTRLSDETAPTLDNEGGTAGDGETKRKTAQMIAAELEKILDSDDTELHDVVAEGIAKIQMYAPKLLPKRQDG